MDNKNVNNIVCSVNVQVNTQKLDDFCIQFINKISSGEITFEEVRSLIMERVSEFIEVKFIKFDSNGEV